MRVYDKVDDFAARDREHQLKGAAARAEIRAEDAGGFVGLIDADEARAIAAASTTKRRVAAEMAQFAESNPELFGAGARYFADAGLRATRDAFLRKVEEELKAEGMLNKVGEDWTGLTAESAVKQIESIVLGGVEVEIDGEDERRRRHAKRLQKRLDEDTRKVPAYWENRKPRTPPRGRWRERERYVFPVALVNAHPSRFPEKRTSHPSHFVQLFNRDQHGGARHTRARLSREGHGGGPRRRSFPRVSRRAPRFRPAKMLSSSSSAALRRNGSFFESAPKVQYPTSASDYAVKEEIGRGVSAKVYRAECIPLGETVAVKMLDLEDDPGHLEEIRREVASMSMVSHPNLVTAHCSFVEGQFLWVVMPFLSGGSALNIMKWSHPKGLDEVSIATILKEVLKALDYFHRNGNIHRDVKAGNVLVDRDGSVKLADFGVSAASWGSGAKPHSTFVGTPCWMAPEVMEQVDGYDFHADIWSLGITVLELCHGHAPFAKYPPMSSAPPRRTRRRNSKRAAEAGHHFTRGLRDFVSVCLQKDPSRPSAAKLLEHRF